MSTQPQSPFFTKLPPELRLEVYRFAFTQNLPVPPSDAITAAKALQTCRQFAEEAASILYNNITFHVNISRDHVPSIFMHNEIAPRIRHLAVKQIPPPQDFRRGTGTGYRSLAMIMDNLDDLSIITYGATFLLHGDIPPQNIADVREDALFVSFPRREDMVHFYLRMLFYTSRIRHILKRRKGVTVNLVVFYYRLKSRRQDPRAVLMPLKTLHYQLGWRKHAILFEFQKYLEESDRLWRMQYERQTVGSLEKYRLFGYV